MSDQYVRVFCTDDKIPAPDDILDFVKAKGVELEIDSSSETSLVSAEWTIFNFRIKDREIFFITELLRPELDFEGELAGEILDFITEINDTMRRSQGKKKVLQHLAATKFYVAVLLSPELEDDGIRAVAAFLQYFTTYCDGMIQDDAAGFFEGKKLLLKFEWKS